MLKKLLSLKVLGLLLLGSGVWAQVMDRPNDELIQRALMQTPTEQNLSNSDLTFELTDYYTDPKNGIQHIYLRQQLNGLEIMGTESAVHLSKQGQIAVVSNKFVNSLEKRAGQTVNSPQLSAIDAANKVAAKMGYPFTKSLTYVSQDFSNDHKAVLSDGGFSLSNIPARLMYLLNENGELNLVWELSIEAMQQAEWYNFIVDAQSGEILEKINWVSSCGFEHSHENDDKTHFHQGQNIIQSAQQENTMALLGAYNVFAMPIESPLYGSRSLVLADEAVNLNASPYGWHDTNGQPGPEYQTTRGNNVNAYEDGDNPGYQPDGGATLTFDFPFNQNYSQSNQSEAAAITNLFYWNNIIHDVFYEYGFNEVSGNFQQNNYGNGGLGNDYVRAEAQDGSGTCNANFGTPPDGNRPTMQMYVCNNRDGDFDNVVIAHEYGHGISIRLTGGPSNVNCLNNQEQMGEGWSDWFGLMLTMTADDQGTDARAIGTYLFGQGTNGAGIRTHRYSTSMSVNPHTYDSIKSEVAPHGVGSVWAVMLWEMTWALIDEYGFDEDIYNGTGGNNIALALVVEALKLQPCSPGFVDGRDAILQADQLLFDGENQCLIWDAFAKRGLGYSANQGSSGSKNDGTQAFDTPSAIAEFTAPADVCEDVEIMTGLSGGTPFGGVYSGPGVTDDGNGSTFTFDPAQAGLGVHTITYSVPETSCAPASSASDEIEVTEGIIVDCPDDITVSVAEDDCSAIVSYQEVEASSGCQAVGMENFDQVSTPNLPEGWVTTSEVGNNNAWRTVSTQSSSTPNSAFAENRSSRSLSSLVSPDYAIDSPNAKLKFDFYYNTESTYDGAVLEYSENGAAWKDILNGGGTFVSGAYNSTISTFYSNPIAGRQAWSGDSGGFVQVEVNLNASMNGKDVKFRWRMGSDTSVSRTGVWLDNVEVEGVYSEEPIITQIAGLTSGSEFPVGTTINTFEITDSGGNVKTCSFEVTVVEDIPPVIVCPEDMIVEVDQGETYTLPDFWADGDVTASDNCSEVVDETQSPIAGTELSPGVHTIEFTVKDLAGNMSTCSFDIKVDGTLGLIDSNFGNSFDLHPNPARDQVVITNSKQQFIERIIVRDLSGRLIDQIEINNHEINNTFSVRHYPSATYLIQIVGESHTTVKKLIKK